MEFNVAMHTVSLPSELKQTLPRAVKMRPSYKWSILLLTIVIWFAPVYVLIIDYPHASKLATLTSSGAEAEGTVTGKHAAPPRGRSRNYTYYLDYTYKIPTTGGHQVGEYKGTWPVAPERYNILVGQNVPVIFDPKHPDNSALNFDDRLHKIDPYFMEALIAKIFGGLYAVSLGWSLFTYNQEKKLVRWGTAAKASIVSQQEVSSGRSLTTCLIYEFEDIRGQSFKGTRNGLPTKKQMEANKGSRKYFADITDNPIALYDPNKATRNMLYPGRSTVCYKPSDKII